MAIVINGTTGIDMGNTPVSNIVNGDNNDAVNKDYAVGKVTSTDNAVVRFDGTTGAVQNSNVIIADSGNIGMGVTPSVWSNGYNNIEIGAISSFGDYTRGGFFLTQLRNNAYENSGWKYKQNGYASMYEQNVGLHSWSIAPSGTAGSPIPWNTAMTLNATGNLLVGALTDNGVDKLQVNGSISSGGIQQYTSGDVNNFKYITQTIGTYPIPHMSNIPINDHGYLEIIVYSANSYVMQRFTTLGALQTAGRVFVRCLSKGTWTDWVEK